LKYYTVYPVDRSTVASRDLGRKPRDTIIDTHPPDFPPLRIDPTTHQQGLRDAYSERMWQHPNRNILCEVDGDGNVRAWVIDY
jgi:hypothetical protein